jgi:ABC-type lipoprotein release transport system permease subunit
VKGIVKFTSGWTLFYAFPWTSVATVVALALVTSVAAAFYPGRVAARTPVRDALAYE